MQIISLQTGKCSTLAHAALACLNTIFCTSLTGRTEKRIDLFLCSLRAAHKFGLWLGLWKSFWHTCMCKSLHVHVTPLLLHAKMPIFWLLRNLAFFWCCFSFTWHWSKPWRSLANILKVTLQAAEVRSQSQSAAQAVEVVVALQAQK